MDNNFLRSRLQILSKDEIISEMKHPRNTKTFMNYDWSAVDKMTKEQLIEIILNNKAYVWDNNLHADWAHVPRKEAFLRLREAARENWRQRIQLVHTLTNEQLFQLITAPRSIYWVSEKDKMRLNEMTREELTTIALSRPEMAFDKDGEGRAYNPDFWTAKPHQVDHYLTLAQGMQHPLIRTLMSLDGSIPGRGKTITTILTAIEIGVGNILVVAPGQVVPKWISAVQPLGLFEVRVSTWQGVKGTTNKPKQWAKYKPDMLRDNYSVNNDWVEIRKTGGPKGINDTIYDFSFLPELGQNGTGGCLVVFDELHKAKNTKKSHTNEMFNQFVQYLKDLNSREALNPAVYKGNLSKTKYVRAIGLTGSMIEKIDDMPYLLNGLGYINQPSTPAANKFIKTDLPLIFRRDIGDDWKSWYNDITDPSKMLLVYFRVIGRRRKRFSQIPEPVDFILYKIGAISNPYPEDRNDFLNRVLMPNFRSMMGVNWKSEMNLLDRNGRLKAYIAHMNLDCKYAGLKIGQVLASWFENNITFQAMQIQKEDIAGFKRLNQEIGNLLELRAQGLVSAGSVLAEIQKALTQLEIFKIAPFTELARHGLSIKFPNGARPSIVFSMLRNGTIRQFAWKMEAILEMDALSQGDLSEEEIIKLRTNWINAIQREIQTFFKNDQHDLRFQKGRSLKSSFKIYSVEDLNRMNMEDLYTEFVRWIYYLDVDLFRHVAILVSGFGIDSSSFDLDSEDESKHIKDPMTLKPYQKAAAKKDFYENSKKVFITNPDIAAEGIDLHDVSVGGMHPRIMLMSPGIIANKMIQMSKRVSRENQTSESFTIMGYVDNVENIQSWEARMMSKLAEKTNQIQMLHTSEIQMDIERNIEEDGKSILAALVDDMKAGRLDTTGINNPGEKDMGTVKKILYQSLSGKGSKYDKDTPCTFDSTSQYLSAAKIEKTKSPQGSVFNPLMMKTQITINILESELYVSIVFDPVSLASNPINQQQKTMIDIFSTFKLAPEYYMFTDKPYQDQIMQGVVIYRHGMLMRAMNVEKLKKLIENGYNATVKVTAVIDRDFEHLNYKPRLTTPKFVVGFFDDHSVMFAPPFPANAILGNDFYNVGFSIKAHVNPLIMLIEGTKKNVAVLFYAMIYIYREASDGVYQTLSIADSENVRNANGDSGKYLYEIRSDGKFYVYSSSDILKYLPLIVGLSRTYNAAVIAGEIIDFTTYKDDNGNASVVIKGPYINMIKGFLDQANGL
jgi:hypothetical protein